MESARPRLCGTDALAGLNQSNPDRGERHQNARADQRGNGNEDELGPGDHWMFRSLACCAGIGACLTEVLAMDGGAFGMAIVGV